MEQVTVEVAVRSRGEAERLATRLRSIGPTRLIARRKPETPQKEAEWLEMYEQWNLERAHMNRSGLVPLRMNDEQAVCLVHLAALRLKERHR